MIRTGLTKKVPFEPKLQKDKYFAVEPAFPISTSYLLLQNLWEWGLEIHVLTSLLCPAKFRNPCLHPGASSPRKGHLPKRWGNICANLGVTSGVQEWNWNPGPDDDSLCDLVTSWYLVTKIGEVHSWPWLGLEGSISAKQNVHIIQARCSPGPRSRKPLSWEEHGSEDLHSINRSLPMVVSLTKSFALRSFSFQGCELGLLKLFPLISMLPPPLPPANLCIHPSTYPIHPSVHPLTHSPIITITISIPISLLPAFLASLIQTNKIPITLQ